MIAAKETLSVNQAISGDAAAFSYRYMEFIELDLGSLGVVLLVLWGWWRKNGVSDSFSLHTLS